MKSKKGFDANQIFVFVLAIVIVGLVLLFGTKAIMRWQSDMQNVEYIRFKTNVQNAIDDVAADYGSVKQKTFNLPGQYKKVCFVGFPKPANIRSTSMIDGEEQPLMVYEWEEKTANVFLIDSTVEKSFLESKITIDPEQSNGNYLCFKDISGSIRVRLEGIGRTVKISHWKEG
ncbi:MAG: hypothetical protein ACOCWQ_01535 [Nanoarchaeota archaeon]